MIWWSGALEEAVRTKTVHSMPENLQIIESDSNIGNVLVTLSAAKDQDSHSGFIKSVVVGNEILKSKITIYDVGSLSDEMLAAITRHEFRHATDLGHSASPKDIMASNTGMQIPYMPECNISAIILHYAGNESSQAACEN